MDNGQVENLPLYSVSSPDAQEIQIPLEAMLSAQLAKDLAGSGFTSLICKPNRDSAYVLRAPMLHRAEVYDDESATATSYAMTHLPYQLLASRISEAVASRLPQVRLSVELQEEPDKQGKRQLVLKIHTGKQIVNGADVQLGFFV